MKLPETTAGYAVKTFAYTLLAAVLCFFLHMSITMALSISSTERLGMRTGGVMEDGRTLVVEELTAREGQPAHRKIYILETDDSETVLTDHDIADGDDGDKAILDQYPVKQTYSENIRSAVDPALKKLSDWVAQILMLILFLAFPYSTLWYLGDRDRNSVQFGHMAENKWRGAVIGVWAESPAIAAWIILIIGKLAGTFDGFVRWYRWGNVCVWPYFNSFIPAAAQDPAEVAWSGVAAMIPVLVALPLITGVGYLLGYREFSVRDKLVYATTGKRVKHRRK